LLAGEWERRWVAENVDVGVVDTCVEGVAVEVEFMLVDKYVAWTEDLMD